MEICKNGKNWLIIDQLDSKLIEKIADFIDQNLNNLLKQKEGYSTEGKNAEQYFIINPSLNFYFKNKEFEQIQNEYKNQVLDILKKSQVFNERIENKLKIYPKSAWTVIGEENSYHTAHFHNSGISRGISTVLYLKVPETNIENNPENNIYLIMDSNERNMFYNNEPRILNIDPKIGGLLIFPNWIIHGTYPQSEGTRQTFNTDYLLDIEDTSFSQFNYV